MSPVFRVLDDDVTRDDFAEAARELSLVSERVFENEEEEDYEEVWVNAERSGAVHYVEDSFTDLRYISLHGDAGPRLLEDLRRKVAIRSPQALLEAARDTRSDPNELASNLFRIATTFSDYDPDVHEIFGRYATAAPYPRLRAAALDAIGLRAWEELRPIVETVAREDPDPEVREHAKAVLDRWIAARGA